MFRRRWLLVAAPLCVVSVAASVAFASTPDTEHTKDTKLDNLHEVRPIAASDQPNRLAPVLSRRERLILELQREIDANAAREAADRAAAEAFLASLAAPPPEPAIAAPASDVAGSPTVTGDASGALACIRARESDSAGGYQAVSSGGTYRGAYQFLQSTWDSAAGAAGRSDLVGVDPATVSPSDQDAVASYLYGQAGSQPWGGTC